MQFQLKPINKLTYKLKLTPQIKLAINLLQLPLLKLKEFITQQIEENPLLLDIENTKPISRPEGGLEKQNYRETLITNPITLQEHLLRQLQLLTNSDYERKIGELIIGNIDDNGYLGCSIEDIAECAKTKPTKVEKVLFLIQGFDPIGVGARDLRECLLPQLKTKGEENSLAGQIVNKFLPFLEKKRFGYIAKKLKISIEIIKEALKEIVSLDPKPGRSFSTERTLYLIPDAMVRKNKDGYSVLSNDWELPHITINDKYKRMIKELNLPEDTKEYLRERLESARSLINAINRRKETVQKITEAIVYFQKDFLDKGEVGFKPMTLSQIADMAGRHKSTVSRAISNKYIQTPHGIFELRYFLSSGVKQESGLSLSSKTIKSKIKALIQNENKANPLTDQKIAEHLNQQGISISRRTIAKYRTQLKLLSSKSRRS